MVDTQEVIMELQNTVTELLQVLEAFTQEQLNNIAFEGSWTAAQVAQHILLSNSSIIQYLPVNGKTVEREPGKGIEVLRNTFLDFSTKLKSPDFIIPREGLYKKEEIISNVKTSFAQLNQISNTVDLSGAIVHPALGEITKFEMLHFVIYHTQRHINQLKKIAAVYNNF